MHPIWKGVVVAVLLCVIPTRLPATSADSTKAASLVGSWLGTLKAPPSMELRVVFNFTAKPDGSLSGTLDSPDQGATGIAVSKVTFENGRVHVEVARVQGSYDGTLNADGSELSGKWMQSGVSLDLIMTRVKEVPKVQRPQEPKRPYPYIDEEVTYQNAKDSVTLAGTLTMPRAGGPFPAVILISGSGQQDRDESVFGHRPFLVLADFLTRRGIAVLRVDDRGVGGSKGDLSQATSEDFANDVIAGIEYLKTRKEIDSKRIGLIGHSEGGCIAPIVAVRSKDVSFIVLMAGTGVTGDVIIESQIVNLLKAGGADQDRIDATIHDQRRVIEVVKNEPDPNLAGQKIREIITDAVSRLDEKQKQAIQYNDGYVNAQVRAATSKWFRFFITHDPKETLRKVKCPVLAINGELDMQVPAGQNLPAIEQALREGKNPDITVKELPGLNHLFQTARTGAVTEYARIEETMSPVALETIAGWIEAHGKRK
jgi:pimeloyl-ACP methyl ester carboxylesterase